MTNDNSELYPSTVVQRVAFGNGGIADVLMAMVGDDEFKPEELLNEYRKQLEQDAPEKYMILFYTYDPYGQGQARYESTPEENFHFIVLNASAWESAGEKERSLLRYVATGKTSEDPFLEELDETVKKTAERLAKEGEI